MLNFLTLRYAQPNGSLWSVWIEIMEIKGKKEEDELQITYLF